MSSALEKALEITELLSEHPLGISITEITNKTGQVQSGVHRTLKELIRLGYVRQMQLQGHYALTMKLPALGLAHLGRAGINDVVQPVLDRLAHETGELIRLSVIDGDNLVWVAVAQGAVSGLRYDPGQEQGVVAHIASTAGGQAWLSTLDDDAVIMKISQQGLIREASGAGQNAPKSFAEIIKLIQETRDRGYAISIDSYIAGMTAIAIPVLYLNEGPVLGCISVAGPTVRVTPQRIIEIEPFLKQAAAEIGSAAAGSNYFQALLRPAQDN